MRRALSTFVLGGCVQAALLAPAQDAAEVFCSGNRDSTCLPDSIEIVFPPGDSPADDGSSIRSTEYRSDLGEGALIRVRVVIDVKTPGVEGFSYAVRHDPQVLSLESVSTAGTAVDPEHPRSVSAPPYFDATAPAVPAPGADPSAAGFFSGVVLSFMEHRELPLGRQAVCNATYRAVRPFLPGEETVIRIVDGELSAQNSPPVRINLTAGGTAALPQVLVHGVVRRVEAVARAPEPHRPCDANDDGALDIADPLWITNRIYRGGDRGSCPLAADCDGDEQVHFLDATYILRHLFLGGAPPPPPFPRYGSGESGALGCDLFLSCSD